jgi:hypothetical protein
MKIKGRFSCNIIKADGTTVSWQKDNMIVNSGYEFLMTSMFEKNNRPYPISYIAFGSGSNPTTADMTALENEVIRVPAEWRWDPEAKVVSVYATVTITEPVIITEAGLFNAETEGVMFDRVTFIAKGLDETDIAEPVFDISVI